MREEQRDVLAEIKSLRLHGMASAWADLVEQGGGGKDLESSRWLVEHLLQAEEVDRHMRSIAHQTKAARFPIHRDLTGFDFEVSPVDKALIQKLADLSFTDDAQNVVLIGPPRHNTCRLLRTKKPGAAMKDRIGTIRTNIQGPSSSPVVAA